MDAKVAASATRPALVDDIYQTIRAPEVWPDVIRKIGGWLKADCGLMLSPSLPGVFPVPLASFGIDIGPVLAKYPKHAGRTEFTKRALATGRGPGVFLLDELMPLSEQQTNDFWLDVIAPLGLTTGLFCLLRTPEEGERAIVLQFYRRGISTPFTRADVDKLASLFPDLRRALTIVLDAPARTEVPASMAEVYDAISAPCILLNAGGGVVHTNRAAFELLKSRSGLDIRAGRIVLTDAQSQVQLSDAIARMVTVDPNKGYVGAELLVKPPADGSPLILILAPIGVDNALATFFAPVRCVVFVLEQKLRSPTSLAERLRRLYTLTPAEAQVCLDVASGLSLLEISTQRRTAIGTVRTQVKSALTKTGFHRQADLASLVNRLRF